jgi:Fe-S-cluster containining protein
LIIQLSQAYRCRYGVPVISGVDTAIFVKTFYGECMECTFCHDACCQYGADVTALDHANIQAQADELEDYLGLPRGRWFTHSWQVEADWPGGKATGTRVEDERCVFLNRQGRGCRLHSYAMEKGIDVHEIKPMVCLLWPVTWWEGVLQPSNEIVDNDLICLGPGQTCYRSSRNDIAYYFGAHLVSELDGLEAAALKDLPLERTDVRCRRVSLPIAKRGN